MFLCFSSSGDGRLSERTPQLLVQPESVLPGQNHGWCPLPGNKDTALSISKLHLEWQLLVPAPESLSLMTHLKMKDDERSCFIVIFLTAQFIILLETLGAHPWWIVSLYSNFTPAIFLVTANDIDNVIRNVLKNQQWSSSGMPHLRLADSEHPQLSVSLSTGQSKRPHP